MELNAAPKRYFENHVHANFRKPRGSEDREHGHNSSTYFDETPY